MLNPNKFIQRYIAKGISMIFYEFTLPEEVCFWAIFAVQKLQVFQLLD